jgi:transposase InsO family protein
VHEGEPRFQQAATHLWVRWSWHAAQISRPVTYLRPAAPLPVPSTSTIRRILGHHGLITPQPRKRPKSSYIRSQAAQPNQCWQSDFTHWTLADGTDVEILNWHTNTACGVDRGGALMGVDQRVLDGDLGSWAGG